MTKAQDAARVAGIVNSWEYAKRGCELLGAGTAWVSYTPADNGRGGRSAYARVDAFDAAGVAVKTDPAAHWQDRGKKTFNSFDVPERGAKTKPALIALACEWANENLHVTQYDATEWMRDPFGGWHPPEVVKAVDAWIKEQS